MSSGAAARFVTIVVAVAAVLASAGCRDRSRRNAASASAPADAHAANDDVAGWRSDLALLASELPKLHPAPFHQTPEPAFRAAVADLDRALPALTLDQRIVGLARIVALLADAHTQLQLGPLGRALVYPISFYWFPDGIFVIAAADRAAIGARLITVGGRPVDDAIAALSSTIGWQADGYRRAEVAWRLAWPQFVRGTGLAPADGAAHFGLVDATGATRDLALEPAVWRMPAPDGEVPLYRQKPGAFYWLRPLPDARALYVQYNRCADAPDLSFAAFTQSAVAILDAQPVDRLIIDLRWNQGGNSAVIKPLLDAIAARPDLGHRLFALISRHTFSSGLMNAIDLDRLGAVLVGEPAGSPTDHNGEIRIFALPATGLAVQHATRHFAFPGYTGPALAPDLAVDLTSADYLAGRDPVLAAALAAPVPPH